MYDMYNMYTMIPYDSLIPDIPGRGHSRGGTLPTLLAVVLRRWVRAPKVLCDRCGASFHLSTTMIYDIYIYIYDMYVYIYIYDIYIYIL